MTSAGIETIDISKPYVMACLFVGAMLPYLFSAMAIDAVGRAAMSMIQEVRRQFRSIPQLQAALDVMKRNGDTPAGSVVQGRPRNLLMQQMAKPNTLNAWIFLQSLPSEKWFLPACSLYLHLWQLALFTRLGKGSVAAEALGGLLVELLFRRAFSTIPVKCRRCMGQCQKDV